MGRDPDTTLHRWLTSPSGKDVAGAFPSALLVTITCFDDEALLLVAGEVDHFSAPLLAARLDEAGAAGATHAVLDISAMSFVDAAGLAALVAATGEFRARGGDLILVGARPVFTKLVRLFDLGGELSLGSHEGAQER